ncbi:protein TASOR [Symphorus nematophorus]
MEVQTAREAQAGAGRAGAAAGWMERRHSVPQPVHQRHMPKEPLRFHIPRKTKEKRALFQDVSTESREYEDMMTILTSSYIDTSSAGCFTYCKPRLVHSELLEKEFVEKRKEMKSDGRADKEMEESYCFLLTETGKLPALCEKGLFVGHTWMTVLGNPSKGVYLSRYSDLLQINPLTPGASGEIVIFKVIKGRVKSIYENMKSLLDPTPRHDSHISKNASKVTSLNSYRAFELTQHYFYEYLFDELRQRPRQVCPYAVISFLFKGKDAPLPSKPLAPVRLNSQSAEGNKECAKFTVWSGDLVKHDQVLYQISLQSTSPPFLPHRLPEKLEIGCLMRLDQVTDLLPAELFSYNVYNSSQEVVKNGHCCTLLEVTDRSRSATNVTRLLGELEKKRVVLVTQLTDRGFLFLLSSVQMAPPAERGESWKRCLQALFVFPESRDVGKSTLSCASSSHNTSESPMSSGTVIPRPDQFIPALHHALVKARANPPPDLSAGVERQAREYLIGLSDGKVRQYPMGKYDSKLDERAKPFPAPNHHRVNMDGYLRSYLYNPALYLLSVARAKLMVEAHCSPEEQQEVRLRKSGGGQREATGKEETSSTRDGQTNTQKMQQLMDLVLKCKRNAENEVNRERGGKMPGRKRRLEQETAARTIKFLKASQEPGRHSKVPVDGNQVPVSPGSLESVIRSVGLKDIDLREDGSELAARLHTILTGITQAAKGIINQSHDEVHEEEQRDPFPFDKLATKLGLPTSCDIDLRKQEELEEQTTGSVSSLEGFSPSSHSGETNHHGAAGRTGGGGGRRLGRRAGGYEEEDEEAEIPWVLIPLTERYTQRDINIPQDPRFQHLTTATSIATATKPLRKSPTPSPESSPLPSPFQCQSPQPSPPPSPSQCPSPDPSPPPSPSQCPSPEPSPPASPSQCPSPEPSPPPSPSHCPSPQPSPPLSPSQCPSPQLSHPPSPSRCQSPEPNELSTFNKDHSGANEEQLAAAASRDFAGVSTYPNKKPQEKEEPSISASIQPSISPTPDRTKPSPPPSEPEKEGAKGKTEEVQAEPLEEMETQPVEDMQIEYEEAEEGKRIDSVVDKHMGDFSSEIQFVLQEESIHYSFPQSPHSTSNTDTTAHQHTLPHTPISQFSQYVSFYNPCPPVQDYVSSLQDSINSILTELDESWLSHKPATSRTNTDAALASRVSDFVSSIRAANTRTGRDNEDGLCGELTAADVSASVSPLLSRAAEVWPPLTITRQFSDDTNNRNPPTSHVTLSAATSASGSVYEPTNNAVLHPPPDMSAQSHWAPQESRTLEITRTVTQNIRHTQDSSVTRTVHCAAGGEGGTSLAGSSREVTIPGFGGVSSPSTEPSHPSEQVPIPASVPVPVPDPYLSVVSKLQPEFFSSLEKIMNGVKRNSVQFYLHSTEPDDQVYEDVKEHLLKQGNVEQSPLAFLNQENSDSRLMVIIKNKDIAGHIHKIPGLVSLKRHPTVVFVGIDTLDDIRNKSCNELFVSGGCIISDESVLNPDVISCDHLAALLMLLEQHSPPESVWRWKVHYKAHKRLKEQARFRREAANLLDILSAYQKRQIVEFLTYHDCDMMNHQSPDLNCLMNLQARYTQYRHTVLLTERNFEDFHVYSSCGIIVASIKELLHNFPGLVGYHDIKDRQPIMDDMLSPKGLGRQLSQSDSVSERSPSIFPEPIHSLSSHDQPQHLLQQSGSGPPPHSHLSDQLVPESVLHHSDKDFEALVRALSQIRAEREAKQQQQQQQQQRLDSQAELSISPLTSFLSTPVHTGSRHTTPPVGPGGPTESVHLSPSKKAVAATLESIHSALQPELSEEQRREVGAEGRRSRGGEPGGQRGGTPVRVVGLLGGNLGLSNSHTPTPSSNQNTAPLTGPSNQTDLTHDGRGKADQQTATYGTVSSSTTACPAEGNRLREAQPIRGEGAPPPGSSTVGTASGNKVIGSVTMVTDQEANTNPVVPLLQQIQQPQQHLQHLNNQQLHLQQPAQRAAGLLHPPHLSQLSSQHFSHSSVLTTMGNSLQGPTSVWPEGWSPTGAAALPWGYGRDFSGSRLMGGNHNPAGQGNKMYRGGRRGGGFNGM